MTKTIRIGVAGVAMFAAMSMSTVARADTETADARAEILQALDLTLTEGSLDFGLLVVSGDGAITLPPTGPMDCTGQPVACAGTTDVPDFSVSGTADKAVSITVPTGNVTLTNTAAGSTDTLTVNAITTSAASNEVTLTGGSATFSVGGTLNFTDGQDAGVYTGSFDVSVDYS
ncbi:MAG: DUF4402 domain-containing protein [Pseudomonadota bacterium]